MYGDVYKSHKGKHRNNTDNNRSKTQKNDFKTFKIQIQKKANQYKEQRKKNLEVFY